ncbi:hypothetical protein [Streptomyces sp. NPDC001744]|uniref:hypothetical protein n=1 Tax=Streptomyces sp. NPDC001744 TaxID=3364606 RepID=UPI0036D1F964
MARPKHAEPGREHVPMSELLASCAAARALSTPPRRPEDGERGEHAVRDARGRAEAAEAA